MAAPVIITLEQAKTVKALDLARRDLGAYIRLSWSFLNPGTQFIPGWHIDAMSEHLTAVTRGYIKKLILNIPPVYSKTGVVSLGWPTWEWLEQPWLRYLCASHSQSLSEDMNKQRRDLLASEFYRQGLNPSWKVTEAGVRRIGNDQQGTITAVSVSARDATGRHADRQVLDDPLDARGAWTIELQNHVRWFHDVFKSRMRDGGACVLVAQRLHSADLAGNLLEGEGGWTHLCLPERCDPQRRCVTTWRVPEGVTPPEETAWLEVETVEAGTTVTFTDPRAENEVLCPARFDDEAVAALWADDMSAATIAAQRQQSPKVGLGGIFPETSWRFWHHDRGRAEALGCVTLPEAFDSWCGVLDATFDAGKSNDYTVAQVAGARGALLFVLGQMRGKMDFLKARKEFYAFTQRWEGCSRWLIEKAANGFAIYADLKGLVPGLRYVKAEGSKEQRADGVSSLVEANQVYLPHPEIAAFSMGLIEEAASFPRGTHDDQVDALVYLMEWHLSRRRKNGREGELPEVRRSRPEPEPMAEAAGQPRRSRVFALASRDRALASKMKAARRESRKVGRTGTFMSKTAPVQGRPDLFEGWD